MSIQDILLVLREYGIKLLTVALSSLFSVG